MTKSEWISVFNQLITNMVLQKDFGCWEWQGAKRNGYGRLTVGSRKNNTRRTVTAHRIAYEIFVKEIPQGMWVCHHCDNKACINPEHLFIGTRQDNVDDREAKGRNKPYQFGKHEDHPNSKLTWGLIHEIRSLHGAVTITNIAKNYGVGRKTVSDIVNFKTWIPQPPEVKG